MLPDFRGLGIGAQLCEAEQAWAAENGYEFVRMECQNTHRPVLLMSIKQGFDVVGIRWDPDRHANLVIFEKDLAAYDGAVADEMFITNTLVGIRPVSKYRKKEYSHEVAKDLLSKVNVKARLG